MVVCLGVLLQFPPLLVTLSKSFTVFHRHLDRYPLFIYYVHCVLVSFGEHNLLKV